MTSFPAIKDEADRAFTKPLAKSPAASDGPRFRQTFLRNNCGKHRARPCSSRPLSSQLTLGSISPYLSGTPAACAAEKSRKKLMRTSDPCMVPEDLNGFHIGFTSSQGVS